MPPRNPKNREGMGDQYTNVEIVDGWPLGSRRNPRLRRVLAKERQRRHRHLRQYRLERDETILTAVGMMVGGLTAFGLGLLAFLGRLEGEDERERG